MVTVAMALPPTVTPQEPTQIEPLSTGQSTTAPARTEFHIRYVSGTNVYIDGGRNAGLAEGTALVLKQSTSKSETDRSNAAIEPGVIAKLNVVSVASTSAVCEVVSTKRDLTVDDVVSLPDAEVAKMVEKNTLGNTRRYPMVVTFSEGDPLDEEVRDNIPRPPLPEVNEARGRIGFDMSTISQPGSGGSSSSTYGMAFRADITRMFGTHWNLNGYWRGSLEHSSAAQMATLQETINRTYLMSLSYVNPDTHWTAGIGRLYLPWASSLETIDGGYFGWKFSPKTVSGVFAGSTPDPTAWNYNPQNKVGGAFFNIHGGSFENTYYSSTSGFGVNTVNWSVNRPFVFTENMFSFKRNFSVFHSMQIDKPTANTPGQTINAGLGQSLLTVRAQVHPRVTLDLTDTYFRDVPTYDATLVGTGLLDKYLYQGVNAGARVVLPLHLSGYFSLGRSNNSSDPKSSLNELFGLTMSNIWKTGLQADVRYSKFDSAFASGTYRSATLTKDLGERFRLNVQGGNYLYNSTEAANSNSYFVNLMMDANVGSRYFIENAFTSQRGGTMEYNQWTTTFGIRFDNRAKMRNAAHANHP
jgi:hypothetical protein